jgi:hypothetical protein
MWSWLLFFACERGDSVSPEGAPARRAFHSAVWTGERMIIWGGEAPKTTSEQGADDYYADGAAWDPESDTWEPIADAPEGRLAGWWTVWTGAEMIVWGGTRFDDAADWPEAAGDGLAYDPAADSWRRIRAPSEVRPSWTVWTGESLVVLGGDPLASEEAAATGWSWDPATDVWTPLGVEGMPTTWAGVYGAWTGSELMVWQPPSLLVGGLAVYDPALGWWRDAPTSEGVSADSPGPIVWDGEDAVVFGGDDLQCLVDACWRVGGDGGRYDPDSDSWRAAHPDAPRDVRVALPTQDGLVAWSDDNSGLPGARRNLWTWDREDDAWRSSGDAPRGDRIGYSAIWTGEELVVWGGRAGRAIEARDFHPDGFRVVPP